MSKISALAQDFERSAIERSRATDEAVRSALLQHESALAKALSESEQRTGAAILASQKRLRSVALTSWLTVAVLLASTFLAGAGWVWWLQRESAQQEATIERQQRTIERLNALGGGVQLSTCDGRPCVAIDLEAPVWGKNSEFRMLDLEEN